ncbi:hypothetical protein [Chitinophaga solisilvae]|nr:hypothetical protein [Chitinophaga solisilvae]
MSLGQENAFTGKTQENAGEKVREKFYRCFREGKMAAGAQVTSAGHLV